MSLVYRTGPLPDPSGPLARFLPPLPSGIAAGWLADNAPPASWVLDPFAAAPHLSVEAARAGFRVLVAANNPISRFLLEMSALSPTRDDLSAALARLASTRTGDLRLETYIQSLYETVCDSCESPVSAEAFIWERGGKAPQIRIYHCPVCGNGGEFPVHRRDEDRTAQIAASIGLHRARALERVAALDDPDRQHAEEALSVYLPRAVLALFTLINKVDGLDLSPVQRTLVQALLIFACDAANTQWPYPAGRHRPRQFTQHSGFVETNVWRALERAVDAWAQSASPVPLLPWQENLASVEPGALVVYEGRLTALPALGEAGEIKAVLAALPRPNQAFWTLSALWAGWLWGRDAAGPFKSVLRRRRYEWSWHTEGLLRAFTVLPSLVPPHTPLFGLIGEAEPGFLTSALVSGAAANLSLEGLAVRPGSEQAQLLWRTRPASPDSPPVLPEVALAQQVITGVQSFLKEHGEPAGYLSVHAAALASMVASGPPLSSEEIDLGHATNRVNTLLTRILTHREGFLRPGGDSAVLESGDWWLVSASDAGPPLADTCEIALVDALIRRNPATLAELEQIACDALSGLHTPEPSLIEAILESYAVPTAQDNRLFRLRDEDAPRQRRADLDQIAATLCALGERLGFTVINERPLLWLDESGNPVLDFYPLASANISRYVYAPANVAARGVLVLPGGRANLVMYKIRRDSRLERSVSAGWRFLKFRHVLHLAANPLVTRESLTGQLGIDPLTYTTPQLRLF